MREEDTAPPTKLCRRCGTHFPLDEFLITGSAWSKPRAYCRPCRRAATRQSMRQIRARRLAAGVCEFCGDTPAAPARLCLVHWARAAGSEIGYGTLAGARQLVALLEAQDYRCALTGLPLVPGDNASLDHIVPRAKGGGHALDNLQWVLTEVNLARRVLSVEEFVALCRAVVAHQQ